MQSRTILVLILAVICAASAALGVNQLLRQMEARAKLDTTTVVVAVREIKRGGIITADSVTTREWPTKLIPAGVVTDLASVTGRTAYVPIVKDEPILQAKLVDGQSQALAGLIPPGMRAFTIQTTHTAAGVGGFIVPGNHVDVLLTSSTQSDDGTGGAIATTLLQNIQILAVDQFLDTPDEKTVGQREVKSVTLLVNPDQAAKLSLAANKGTLNLSLRHPDDQGDSGAQPATLSQLRLTQEPPQPSRAAVVAERVVVGFVEAMARASAAPRVSRPETRDLLLKSGDEEQPADPPAPRVIYIQTLRGAHSGYVPVQQ